eukprot:2449798-Amphidinium_carterae.2
MAFMFGGATYQQTCRARISNSDLQLTELNRDIGAKLCLPCQSCIVHVFPPCVVCAQAHGHESPAKICCCYRRCRVAQSKIWVQLGGFGRAQNDTDLACFAAVVTIWETKVEQTLRC